MGIGSINRRGLRWLAWLLASLALFAMLGTTAARADVTINVNTTTDDTTAGNGTCSMREAVLYANGTAEADCAAGTATGTTTINLPAGHYVIANGTLSITGATVIKGSGASNTTIDANGTSEVLNVGATANLMLREVTVTGGASGLVPCTGMFCLLAAEAGAPGGGISNAGSLTLSGSTVSNNVASPGSSGLLLCFTGSACQGRSPAAGGNGGGIYNSGGRLTISSSTISGNKTAGAAGGDASSATNTSNGAAGGAGGASGFGGGIYNVNGTVTITNSTIRNNSTGPGGAGGSGSPATTTGTGGNGGAGGAAGSGGGIESTGTGSLTISGSTINANTTGAGGNGGNGGAGAGGSNGGAAGAGGNGGSGGGIDSAPQVTMQDSTLTGNATGRGGNPGTAAAPAGAAALGGASGVGGALNQSSTGATITQSTVSGNTAAGAAGGLNAGGSIEIENSIIASNHSGSANSNCGGTMYTRRGTNIFFGDNTCGTQGADPKLQPLADNGGPTQTLALAPGSSAVDVVATNDCLSTDQRGVARPRSVACDAGAYELASPNVSAVSAGATSTTTASVTATVNPNFKDTRVVVRYGPTTVGGATTAAQDIGSANSPTSFSARLVNLKPQTTYHAQVVATNDDGATSSGDLRFTTTNTASATLASATTRARRLSVTIVCDHGNRGDRCTGGITVSAHVTSSKGKTVAVTSAKQPSQKRPSKKARAKLVRLGSATYSVVTGTRKTITLTLDKRGRSLLNTRYKVPATLKLSGNNTISRQITFSYGRVRSPVSFTWKFNRRYTVAELLTISSLPAKPKVVVSCHGGGCPFAKKTFSLKAKAKTRKLELAPKLKQAHLKPKTKLQIEITAANAVGKVLIFTIVSNDVPKLTVSCLVPGARKPSACAIP
jgi:CSLREA domain-containing protein